MPLRMSLPRPPFASSLPTVPLKMSLPAPPLNSTPTALVAAEVRDSVVPKSSVKVATTRSSCPTCPAPGVKAAAVASTMSLKVAPPSADACHWKAKIVAVRPSGSSMVPREAVSTRPWVGVMSLIAGAPAAGSGSGVAETSAVGAENTVSSTPRASL
ncbi:hypothetical protein FQZ97_812510 [compost metagenome]